jgi:hypothetical protein
VQALAHPKSMESSFLHYFLNRVYFAHFDAVNVDIPSRPGAKHRRRIMHFAMQGTHWLGYSR